MLDKLNAIADMLQSAIASHPDNKQKSVDDKGPPSPDQESVTQKDTRNAYQKQQDAMRNAFGGQEEPK